MDRPNSRALTGEVTPRAEPERMAAFHQVVPFRKIPSRPDPLETDRLVSAGEGVGRLPPITGHSLHEHSTFGVLREDAEL